MKKIIIILIALAFIGCKEEEPTIYADYDFIIAEKVILEKGYWIKSTNKVVLPCSIKQYIQWEVGDTIPMGIIQNGFFKGEHVIRTRK